MIEPFRIATEQPVLEDLRRRPVQIRLPPSPEKADWEDGTTPSNERRFDHAIHYLKADE